MNMRLVRFLPVIFAFSLAACGANSDVASGPAPLPTDPPSTDVPAGCDTNIEQRLTDGHGYCFDAQFESFDGTSIDMTVYVPQPEKLKQMAGLSADSSEPGYAPLVVHSHGFGGVKASDFVPAGTELDRQVALDLWQAGYWVISFTQRGFGGSSSPIGMMAPDKEGWDFVRLVDWAICHLRADAPLASASAEQNADPEFENCGSNWGASLLATDSGSRVSDFDSDIALGTIGYSYGGGYQFNAQSTDARVDAILPMGTWHDLRYSLHPNDTPKTAWITIMTAFAQPEPAGGGNGEPLPTLLITGNIEAEGANESLDDAPYNKTRQVSVANMNTLAPNGAVAYCDNHPQLYADKYSDLDGEPIALEAANRPAHASLSRAPRADLFMIQGYGDTLFSLNEGFDNARCFETAGREVHYLAQTSGHPLPAIGPAHYAGVDQSMYLDEIVHCGTDASGNPQRYNTRTLGLQWFDAKLRGQGNFSQSFPHTACITQQNADTALVLDTNDPYFANGTTNTSGTAHLWSREGATFTQVSAIPVGGDVFEVPATTLTTGTTSLGQGLNDDPRVQFIPLTTLSESAVLAGIPTANFSVSRANPLADEIFFAGIAVQRCQARPSQDQDASACDSSLGFDLLHFQAMPIRLFARDSVDTSASYPSDDPRNFAGEAKGHVYPVRFGDNPPNPVEGRLQGVTARLYPGDQVGLLLMPEHPVYTSLASTVPGQVTVSGQVKLPFVSQPTAAPSNVPAYVIEN